jgi:hypothetical protein
MSASTKIAPETRPLATIAGTKLPAPLCATRIALSRATHADAVRTSRE